VIEDQSGVGGFFEDLPVLMFVLAGTVTVIVSATFSVEVLASQEADKALERLATRCVDLIVAEIMDGHGGVAVIAGALCATKIDRALQDFLGDGEFFASIVMIHPESKRLCTIREAPTEIAGRASSASRMINVLVENGLTGIVVVRALVW